MVPTESRSRILRIPLNNVIEFYSYLWLREDGSPYYAGKGRGNRAFRSKGHGVHRPKNLNRILVFPMMDEGEAFESEVALIELFGRKDNGTGCLRNLTDGGDGPSGHIHSEKQKERIKASLMGNQRALGHHWTLSPETRTRMSGHPTHFSPLGLKRSSETKAKHRANMLKRFIKTVAWG